MAGNISLKSTSINGLAIKHESNFLYSVNPFILFRDCYKQIYSEISNVLFGPERAASRQKCFLVYCNEGNGKTSFCWFLSCCLINDDHYNGYDITIFSGSVIHRKAGSNEYFNVQYTPAKTKNPTIIICDNVVIHEDDFSEDNIIIMISSPNAKKYKTFCNKRCPIQYYIPLFGDDEINFILKNNPTFKKTSIDKVKEFGCNFKQINRINSIDDYLQRQTIKLPLFIPPEYNEFLFIYNSTNVVDIPEMVEFKTEELQRYVLNHCFNQIDNFTDLFKFFITHKEMSNPLIYERLCHIFIENNGYECKYAELNDYTKLLFTKRKYIIHNMEEFYDLLLEGFSHENLNFSCYVDFSSVSEMPGIDGMLINMFSIVGVQMTISPHHVTKNSIIVFLSVYIYVL